MCHYEVVDKDTLPEVDSTYPSAFVCNTHDGDQPEEHWGAMYVDEIGDYIDPYGQNPQYAEFTPLVVNTAALSCFDVVIFQCMHFLAYSQPI